MNGLNRDDIIRMAQEIFRKQMREADLADPMRIHYSTTQHENAAVCVAALAIAAAEREACAKLVEEWITHPHLAITIRARGQR